MAWRIQVAFEGGGSKFIQHLAVAEALEELERSGYIDITRVAGTSAGSLAAAILAAGLSPKEAAEQIRLNKRKFASKLSSPSFPIAMLRLMMQWSLVSDKRLRQVFEEVWSYLDQDQSKRNIEEFSKELIIVASDMVTRKPVIFEKNPADDIITLLVHSCAIPIVYRNINAIRNNEFRVDGGIIENLPVDRFLSETEEYGDVVAITFEEPRERNVPKGQFEYIGCLISMLLSYSVEHIKKRLDNRHVFAIESNLDSLDFDMAFRDYGADSASYEKLKNSAIQWFSNNSKIYGETLHGVEAIPTDFEPAELRIMDQVGRVYNALYADTVHHVSRRTMIVVAYSMLREYMPNHDWAKNADRVEQRLEIQPIDKDLQCIQIRLDWTGQHAPNAARAITVRDAKHDIVKSILLPARNIGISDDSTTTAQGILFFDPPIRCEETELCPITVQHKAYLDGVMSDFFEEDKRRSYIGVRNHGPSTVETAELVLIVPKSANFIEAAWRVEERPDEYVSGEPMTKAELQPYSDIVPDGFRCMGWKTNNLEPEKRFTASLTISDRQFTSG